MRNVNPRVLAFACVVFGMMMGTPCLAKAKAKPKAKPKPIVKTERKIDSKELPSVKPKPPTCRLIGPSAPLPQGGGEVVLKLIAVGQSPEVSAMKVHVTESTTITANVEGPGGKGECSARVEVTPLPDISIE